MKNFKKYVYLFFVVAFFYPFDSVAQVKLDLPVFPVPSLSAFTPPVIKAKGFDTWMKECAGRPGKRLRALEDKKIWQG